MASKTFLVRNANTCHMVGLFCARHSNELFCLIDEQSDPFDCEYLELNAGEGLFATDWSSALPTEALSGRVGQKSEWRSLSLNGFEPSLSKFSLGVATRFTDSARQASTASSS
jgi:hypothetical protein